MNDIKSLSSGLDLMHESRDLRDESKKREKAKETLGAFLVRDNRVLNGPLGRSLRSFARTAYSPYSAHSLRSAPLCSTALRFARSLRSQARSLTSLTPLWDSENS